MCSLYCCGICCGGFSFFCLVFLLVVGAVIESGSQVIHIVETKDFTRSEAAKNCFIGAGIYGGCIVASILMFVAHKFMAGKKSNNQGTPLLDSAPMPLR